MSETSAPREDLTQFIDAISHARTREFLNTIKALVDNDPENAPRWTARFDPNILRKSGVRLPPVFADVQDVFGAKYSVNINDHIGWHLYVRGYFDPVPTLAVKLLQLLGRRGVLIDGGANIGSTCISAALKQVEVFAIEASNSTCAELLKNISMNPSIRATAINAALCSPAQMKAQRYSEIFRSEGNFAAGSLHKTWNRSGLDDFKDLTINTTLDRIVDFHGIESILLLKLDIEGYEHHALEGFQRGLEALRPPVMFEWRPDHLQKTLGRVDDLRPLFPERYRFYSVQYCRIGTGTGTKFGVNLRETDLSHISENVLALPFETVDASVIAQLTGSFVAVEP